MAAALEGAEAAVAGAFAQVRQVELQGGEWEELVLASALRGARDGGPRAALTALAKLGPRGSGSGAALPLSVLVPTFCARETDVDASLSTALAGRWLDNLVFSVIRQNDVPKLVTTLATLVTGVCILLGLCGLTSEALLLGCAVASSIMYIPSVMLWSSLVCRLLMSRFEAWFALFNLAVSAASMAAMFPGVVSVSCALTYSIAVPCGIFMDAFPFRQKLWPGMACGASYFAASALLLASGNMNATDVQVPFLGSTLSLRNRAIGAQVNLACISLTYSVSCLLRPERFCMLQGVQVHSIERETARRFTTAHAVYTRVLARQGVPASERSVRLFAALCAALTDLGAAVPAPAPAPAPAASATTVAAAAAAAGDQLRGPLCKELEGLLALSRGRLVRAGEVGEAAKAPTRKPEPGPGQGTESACTGAGGRRPTVVRFLSPTFSLMLLWDRSVEARQPTVADRVGLRRLAEAAHALRQSRAAEAVDAGVWLLGLACTAAALMSGVPVALAVFFVSLSMISTIGQVLMAHPGIAALALQRFTSVFFAANVAVLAVGGCFVLANPGAKMLWLYAQVFFLPRVLFTDAMQAGYYVKLRDVCSYALFSVACSGAFWSSLWELEPGPAVSGPFSARNVFFSALVNVTVLTSRFSVRALTHAPTTLIVVSGVASARVSHHDMHEMIEVQRLVTTECSVAHTFRKARVVPADAPCRPLPS
jgi:hypothetical protein